MAFHSTTVTDDSVLEYTIPFAVLPRDLGIWRNGDKQILDDDYTFNQSKNSVTFTYVEIGDVIQFRIFKDKV